MKRNVGGLDRTLRLVAGTTALNLGLFAPLKRGVRAALVSFGASELITGLARYCPLNQALGFNTAKPRNWLGRKIAEMTT